MIDQNLIMSKEDFLINNNVILVVKFDPSQKSSIAKCTSTSSEVKTLTSTENH